MRFQDSLERNPAPKRLGDVRLRYDTDLLVGETPKPVSSARPALYLTLGFGCGIVAAALLLLPGGGGGSTFGAIAFGALAAFFVAMSTFGEQKEKRQRRFALNFFTETLRVDRPSKVRGAPETVLVKFDDVTSVGLTGSNAGGAALWVEFRTGRELLIDGIPEEQGDDLVRVHRILEGAFGLRRPERPYGASDDDEAAGDDEPQDSFEG